MQTELFPLEIPSTDDRNRVLNDFYPTPPEIVKELVGICPEIVKTSVFEPFDGHGAISDTLREFAGCYCLTNDIVKPLKGTKGDATMPILWAMAGTHEWTITNPAYCDNIPDKAVPLAWEHSSVGVAMLLRLSMLEPCESRRSWSELLPYLSYIAPINPRIKFRRDKKGTDSVASAWFVWKRKPTPLQIVPITDWKGKVYKSPVAFEQATERLVTTVQQAQRELAAGSDALGAVINKIYTKHFL